MTHKKSLWPNLRYWHGIYVVRTKKSVNFSHDNQFLGQDLNRDLPKYGIELLTTRPNNLVTLCGIKYITYYILRLNTVYAKELCQTC
jgi:hypothetical protein